MASKTKRYGFQLTSARPPYLLHDKRISISLIHFENNLPTVDYETKKRNARSQLLRLRSSFINVKMKHSKCVSIDLPFVVGKAEETRLKTGSYSKTFMHVSPACVEASKLFELSRVGYPLEYLDTYSLSADIHLPEQPWSCQFEL